MVLTTMPRWARSSYRSMCASVRLHVHRAKWACALSSLSSLSFTWTVQFIILPTYFPTHCVTGAASFFSMAYMKSGQLTSGFKLSHESQPSRTRNSSTATALCARAVRRATRLHRSQLCAQKASSWGRVTKRRVRRHQRVRTCGSKSTLATGCRRRWCNGEEVAGCSAGAACGVSNRSRLSRVRVELQLRHASGPVGASPRSPGTAALGGCGHLESLAAGTDRGSQTPVAVKVWRAVPVSPA